MKLAAAETRRIRRLYAASETTGIAVYAVGGCVRDALLRRATRDIDLVVDGDVEALARAVQADSGGSFEVFDRFKTVRFRWPDGGRVDLARARTERYPKPAALPVVRPAPFPEDLKRRDFTINAMARRVVQNGLGPLIDPFGGRMDLKKRLLRALHAKSFQDDPTRLFRAARYAGRFGVRPEPLTAAWMMEALPFTPRLSRERVRQEFWRILEEPDPAPTFQLIEDWDLNGVIGANFRYMKSKERDPRARLGLCAAVMTPKKGEAFLRSFPFSREFLRPLLEALRLIERGRSPTTKPDALAERIVRGALRGLKPASLKPAFLSGADLKAAGLKPGPAFSRILNESARAQWLGKITSRGGALAWLKGKSR